MTLYIDKRTSSFHRKSISLTLLEIWIKKKVKKPQDIPQQPPNKNHLSYGFPLNIHIYLSELIRMDVRAKQKL